MSKETAKAGIDLLFKMWDEDNPDAIVNKSTKGITLDFIGGEPLMNIEVIDYICSYFVEQCLEKSHPWLFFWRASMISNGALYFEPEVQEFLKKFKGFISFGITIDGPKEIHDACRKWPNGEGTFETSYSALKHFNENYYANSSTKVTIAPENLKDLNKIVKFFIDENVTIIYANPVFEVEWTIEQAKEYYQELIKMADYLLELDNKDTYISLFQEQIGVPMDPIHENLNWCGGAGDMLAFDPDGIAYPCIRYMESSLGDSAKPIIIGDVNGLLQTEEQKHWNDCLNCMTRCSQSTEECINCPVASGCAWCSGWNYQQFGELNKRSTNICWMHKARVLANYYYWNKYYYKYNIEKGFVLNLTQKDIDLLLN
jgi:radical SAM peptide maturase (CXXX-repeat target family)